MANDPRLEDLQTVPLFRLITVAGQLLSRHFHRIAEAHDLSPGTLALVMALSNRDDLTHREAAEWCWLSPGTLTGLVDRLEQQGLVERHRQDDDRRVVRIRFTAAGRERAAAVRVTLAERFGSAPTTVGADEEAVIRRYLVAAVSGLLDTDQKPTGAPTTSCAPSEAASPTPPRRTENTADTNELASTAVRRTMQ